MTPIPMEHGLLVAAALFVLGFAAILIRRNLVFVLMGIEIMLNACGLAFIVAGAQWIQADGQIMYILVTTLAAAEAAIGLALILQLDHRFTTVDVDAPSQMRG